MDLPVVNHPDYEAQLNDDNKFPIKKFGELAKALIKNKIEINSIRPIIINKIKTNFNGIENSVKFKFSNPCKLELTVFINVRIDILRHFSNSSPEKEINEVSINKDMIKIIIDRKYLLISFTSKFVFEKSNLFINIFLGLLKESI